MDENSTFAILKEHICLQTSSSKNDFAFTNKITVQ